MCGRFALDHDADELSDLLASQLARTNRYQQQQTPEEEEEATRDGEQEQEGEGEQIDEPVELAEEPRVPVPSGSGIRPAAVGKERSVRINWDSSKEMSMFKRRYNVRLIYIWLVRVVWCGMTDATLLGRSPHRHGV